MTLMVTCSVWMRTPRVAVGSCAHVTRVSRVYSERRVTKCTLLYVYRTREHYAERNDDDRHYTALTCMFCTFGTLNIIDG